MGGRVWKTILSTVQASLKRCSCACPRSINSETLLLSQAGCPLTLVVFTLFPEEQLHPFRSGRTLHSSPSRQGCMWHHHFCSTIEATGDKKRSVQWFLFGHSSSGCTKRNSFSHHWLDWVLKHAPLKSF